MCVCVYVYVYVYVCVYVAHAWAMHVNARTVTVTLAPTTTRPISSTGVVVQEPNLRRSDHRCGKYLSAGCGFSE